MASARMALAQLAEIVAGAGAFSALCLKARCGDEHGADQRHERRAWNSLFKALAEQVLLQFGKREARVRRSVPERSLVRCSRIVAYRARLCRALVCG